MNFEISGLYGGLLIGLASTLLLFLNGRIAGISGIARGLLSAPFDKWRVAFVLGLIVGGIVYQLLVGPIVIEMQVGNIGLVVAGLLVGIGTSIGSGCTSGHGVCGLGRLSSRSLVATITFMLVAIITVFVVRHLL